MLKNQNSINYEQYNEESIDPIDRMIDSINKREELQSTMVKKQKKMIYFLRNISVLQMDQVHGVIKVINVQVDTVIHGKNVHSLIT